MRRKGRTRLPDATLATMLRPVAGRMPRTLVADRNELLHELMAVFDELPAALRDAINYAPEPLDPKDLAALCRRHGAANVLAMIELKLARRAERPAKPR
jgi:hypothetical protein